MGTVNPSNHKNTQSQSRKETLGGFGGGPTRGDIEIEKKIVRGGEKIMRGEGLPEALRKPSEGAQSWAVRGVGTGEWKAFRCHVGD